MTDPHPRPDTPAPCAGVPAPPEWAARLMEQMELGTARPDLTHVASVAHAAQRIHPQDPDAGASAAFIAGYAAGLAEGTGQADFTRAHRAALRAVERLIAENQTEGQVGPA